MSDPALIPNPDQLQSQFDNMDQQNQQNSFSPRRQISHIPPSVRQPVSCEPCRHRKIKCSRTRPFCDTCRRRGCVNRCVYKGTRDTDVTLPQSSSNAELLNRINNLEQLLRQHTNVTAGGNDGQLSDSIPSPLDSGQNSQLSPESLESEPSYRSAVFSRHSSSTGHGFLTSTPEGNLRYEPRTSQWTSVLANTNLSIATPSLEDQDSTGMSFGFPFEASAVSTIDEIQLTIPPMQQCDYLKNQYFAVFSPVRVPIPTYSLLSDYSSSVAFPYLA